MGLPGGRLGRLVATLVLASLILGVAAHEHHEVETGPYEQNFTNDEDLDSVIKWHIASVPYSLLSLPPPHLSRKRPSCAVDDADSLLRSTTASRSSAGACSSLPVSLA